MVASSRTSGKSRKEFSNTKCNIEESTSKTSRPKSNVWKTRCRTCHKMAPTRCINQQCFQCCGRKTEGDDANVPEGGPEIQPCEYHAPQIEEQKQMARRFLKFHSKLKDHGKRKYLFMSRQEEANLLNKPDNGFFIYEKNLRYINETIWLFDLEQSLSKERRVGLHNLMEFERREEKIAQRQLKRKRRSSDSKKTQKKQKKSEKWRAIHEKLLKAI